MGGERWNSSLHAFQILLDAVPDGLRRGLDVGCGEGETARRLRERVPVVMGLDPDRSSIEQARSHNDDITYVVGDIASADLAEASFDVVSAVGVLHHTDQRASLGDLARLLRPDGFLVVVGLARSRSLKDFTRDAVDTLMVRRHTFRRPVWETPSPKVWPPPLSYAQTRKVSLEVLPSADFRRLPYFRYGLTWVKPPS